MVYCIKYNEYSEEYSIIDLKTMLIATISKEDLLNLISTYGLKVENMQFLDDGQIKVLKVQVLKFNNNTDYKNAVLCTRAESQFTLDNINFNSVEQYLLYCKAMMFKDHHAAKEIINIKNSSEYSIRKLIGIGNKITNQNNKLWESRVANILHKGLTAKYSQNSQLLNELLKTENKVIANCTVRDKILGTGLDIHNELSDSIRSWKGYNILGRQIMRVRNELRNK